MHYEQYIHERSDAYAKDRYVKLDSENSTKILIKEGGLKMAYYKKEEVIGIRHNGFFHVACYEGNLDDIEEQNTLTENDFDEEDFLFCDKCAKPILRNS